MTLRPLQVTTIGIAAALLAAWLLPRALPVVALRQSVTRNVVLVRADSFFRAHELAPANARSAVRFEANDSLRTFVELAGGGHDSLNALVRGDDVAPFAWTVRAFAPDNPREARVSFAPDGRIIAFQRLLADTDARPTVTADSGRRLAAHVLDDWINDRSDRWTLVTASYETKAASGRVDRIYTFERKDRRIGGAPIRTDVAIAGDLPARVRPYVRIPESFQRRYAEMRSANDLLALLATLGVVGVGIAGMVALTRYARAHQVRWRESLTVAGVIGVLTLAAGLNEIPGSWFWYDTAMSPVTFRILQFLLALTMGVSTVVVTGLTLAAAEVATRHAFPWQLDWWKLWRYRGTKEVASRVGAGYAVAAIAFAYVAAFYLVTRTLFGWWVPSELLDDPNLIASPMPWLSGIAVSLNAGVWEEALFRALPLSLLSLWVGQRPRRRWWMAAGVVASALIFGFAHAEYESWPPYSRGVEIFLDATFWAVLFLAFGLLVTVVAHFVYDLVLFGIFATAGNAIEYRVTAAIILLALLSPAIVVLWRGMRQRGFRPAPDDARFAAWVPEPAREQAAVSPPPRPSGGLTSRSRRLALAAFVVGVVAAVASPPERPLGPSFTANRHRAALVADSVLRARGGDPAAWKRLVGIGRDTLDAWPRFLRKHKLVAEGQTLATTYAPPAWWIVRYVRTAGTAAERVDEWRVRVRPDGQPLDARHLIPDSARRSAVDTTMVRRIALATLARQGIDTTRLRESKFEETARPQRRDATVTWTDTTVKLPEGAAARAWVQLAGDEPVVARRGVELPEVFLRADRARQTNRLATTGIVASILLALVIVGAIVVTRRRAPVIDDLKRTKTGTLAVLGAIVLLSTLSNLNSLPSRLVTYDTAEPWDRFVTTTALGFVSAIPVSLLLLGLLLVADALRRRIGVPFFPEPSSSRGSKDVLAAGLGLGAVAHLVGQADMAASRDRVPDAATTVLDRVWPQLAGVVDLPVNVLVTVTLAAIPILVLGGITRRWSLRLAVVVAVMIVLGAVGWQLRDADLTREYANPVLVLGGLVLLSLAIVRWGTIAAASWIVAALTFDGLSALNGATFDRVAAERVGAVLTTLVSVGLIALCWWHVRRTTPPR